MKKRLLMLLVSMMLIVGIFAAPALAKYDYSCYPWGGFTYHKHWNWAGEEWYHGTDHYSTWNEFWYYEPEYMNDWQYKGWDWCY